MAIRIREEEVTGRVSIYRQGSPEENNSHRAKRENRRDKKAHAYLEDLGVDIAAMRKQMDEKAFAILTKKAFIEALAHDQRRKVEAISNRRAHGLKADNKWYAALAHEVTDYIQKQNGFIWGETLEELYEEIAEALSTPNGPDDLTATDVEFAVGIAESKLLLRRQREESRACIDLPAVA